jgi:hypothetical protein
MYALKQGLKSGFTLQPMHSDPATTLFVLRIQNGVW